MSDSTRSVGRDDEGAVSDLFPLSLELDGSGREPGSMARLMAVWPVTLSPPHKLMLIYIASEGIEKGWKAAEFIGCTVSKAAELAKDLRAWGYVR